MMAYVFLVAFAIFAVSFRKCIPCTSFLGACKFSRVYDSMAPALKRGTAVRRKKNNEMVGRPMKHASIRSIINSAMNGVYKLVL